MAPAGRVENSGPAEPAGHQLQRVLAPTRPTAGAWRDGWFRTGDIGRFDADGYFYFVDCRADYLRRSGENISSVDVESTILQHPDVHLVAAHAVHSDLGEDEVKITVVRHADRSLAEPDLFHSLVDRMPHFALPRYIEFRDSFPINPSGKIFNYQLRDDGITPATSDRVAARVAVAKR